MCILVVTRNPHPGYGGKIQGMFLFFPQGTLGMGPLHNQPHIHLISRGYLVGISPLSIVGTTIFPMISLVQEHMFGLFSHWAIALEKTLNGLAWFLPRNWRGEPKFQVRKTCRGIH